MPELRSRELNIEDEDGVPLVKGEKEEKKPGIKGDEWNIAVLLFLYVLQGIPLGLGGAIPLILTNRNVSYKQQAEFSFAYWPFSIKLLWAPIVDSCFISSFGRRKTWLVPVQYLIGLTMLLLSHNVDYYLGDAVDEGAPSTPQVFTLTCMFFFLNFLAATQDIAVDGWALTMLQRHNVGYASTCNSVGQTAGYFLGYVLFIGLESYGLVTLAGFLLFWGFVFLVATTLVAIFKSEKSENEIAAAGANEEEELELNVVETYAMLWKILRLPLMPVTMFVLLTSKIGFSAADAVTGLKLIENGLPKDKMAMLAIPMMPLQIVLPLFISRYTVGKTPMNIWLKAMPARLLMGLVMAAVVFVTPSFKQEDGQFPTEYYALVLFVYALHQITLYSMFVAIMAFFARISDPAVGGTYMTLLNTLTNLGGNWPATLALWFVDAVTERKCDGATFEDAAAGAANVCEGAEQKAACTAAGGECLVVTEGYYLESIGCVIIGFLWLAWGWPTVKRLQAADLDEWKVVGKKEKSRQS